MLRLFILVGLFAQGQILLAQNIVAGEYWVDNDPGFGLATPFDPALPQLDSISDHLLQVTSPDLDPGMHTIGYRTKDDNSRWSLTKLRPIFVADSSHGIILEVEYFWDVDPGFGQSPTDTVFANPALDWQGTVVATVPLGIGQGDHILYMRSKDSRGRWSLTNVVDTVSVDSVITLSLAESANMGATIFPNPFNETLTLSTADGKPVRLTLYDANGRLVLDRFIRSSEPIDVSGHASGPYTVFLWKDKNRILKTTLIKQ